MASLFLFVILSLKMKYPPKVMNRILPALNRGNATEVVKVSRDRIKKYEEKRLGIPTAKPVRTSFILTSAFFFLAYTTLMRKATKKIKNKNTDL